MKEGAYLSLGGPLPLQGSFDRLSNRQLTFSFSKTLNRPLINIGLSFNSYVGDFGRMSWDLPIGEPEEVTSGMIVTQVYVIGDFQFPVEAGNVGEATINASVKTETEEGIREVSNANFPGCM